MDTAEIKRPNQNDAVQEIILVIKRYAGYGCPFQSTPMPSKRPINPIFTDSVSLGNMIIKTGGDLMPEDVDLFRSHHKRSFWEHHLERWQQSGLSQRAYCMEHKLKSHQFYYWRRRIQKPHSDVSFLPVTLPEGSVGYNHTVRIFMPNGCVIELEGWQEPTQLEHLVSMVAAL